MGEHRRRRLRRAARGLLWAAAAGHVLETVWLRRRRNQLVDLPAPSPGSPATVPDDLTVLAAAGVDVDHETLAAVAAEMAATGATVVDLVPGDLPAERALPLLRRIDQDRLGQDPLYAPAGAHEAVVLHGSLATRMGTESDRMLDRGEMLRRTLDAQRHAGGASVVRVAPGLRASPSAPRERWREIEELMAGLRPFVSLTPGVVGAETAWLALLTAGLVTAPAPALAALAAWSAKPALVLGGPRRRSSPALRPPGLLGASLGRLPGAWAANLRTIVAGLQETQVERAERAATPPPAPPPPDELFEERRATCPWCGSPSLAARVDVGDLVQHKPGTFHLDECHECGHVFQNPRLSLRGLDHYYDQFYDGVTGEATEGAFAGLAALYQQRIDAIGRFTEPRAWLDVGTGHGHFCMAARQRWPEATFDGLDISDSIEVAERRGWVDHGYRGLFPDLADGLPRSYDVVSMIHYLEHTREPRLELGAAAKVLEPGGYLMIDVPDPEAPWAPRLGPYWIHWFQPQHQHFVPCGNLVTALDEAGFETVAVERGPASMPMELSGAVLLAMQRVSRSPHLPWLPVPSRAERIRRCAVLAAGTPVFLAAWALEKIREARLGPDDIGNAYRVIARRR